MRPLPVSAPDPLAFRPEERRVARTDPYDARADMRLYLAGEHLRAADFLAPQPAPDGGYTFRLYAPRARQVGVVLLPRAEARPRILYNLHPDTDGLWRGIAPEARSGDRYAYVLRDLNGVKRIKADPFALETSAPATPLAVLRPLPPPRPVLTREPPRLVYEVHLPSWNGTPPSAAADETARALARRASRLGATHIEFLPLTEYPHADSWGYQVTHYFAPTARVGGPDGLAALIDGLHREGLGVLLDWVGGHFAVDRFGLAAFDGAPLYEARDPSARRHPDWGTLEFDFGEGVSKSFLLSSALFWLERYGFDGLRIDAVSSILYRDYSRPTGRWHPNAWGGRESIEGLGFLRRLTDDIRRRRPGAVLIAEESSNWPGVNDPPLSGGLGFDMCWDCGWIHAARKFFRSNEAGRRDDPGAWSTRIARTGAEAIILPLSHDEVVYGKGTPRTLLTADPERRWANLRLFFTFFLTHPGCPLLFMGQEDAPTEEWDHRRPPLPPSPPRDPERRAFARLLARLGHLRRAGWLDGKAAEAARWIAQNPYDRLVLAYERPVRNGRLLVVHNGSQRMLRDLALEAPGKAWRLLLSTDARVFGGRGRGRCVRGGGGAPGSGLLIDLPPFSSLLFGSPR